MEEAEFTPDQAYQLLWWLTHLLGGRVTIPKDAPFWDEHMPDTFRLAVDHDDKGNAVLVSQKLDWVG